VDFALRLNEPSDTEKPLRLEAKNISEGGMKFSCNGDSSSLTGGDFLSRKSERRDRGTTNRQSSRLEEIDTGHSEHTYGVALEFVSDTGNLRTRLAEESP